VRLGRNRLGLPKVDRDNHSDATEAFRIVKNLDALNPINFMCSVGFGYESCCAKGACAWRRSTTTVARGGVE
jgi:hypothetical protein